MLPLLIALLGSSTAQAGDGPWTLAPGDQSAYFGVGTFRYKAFAGESPGAGTLGEGVTAVGAVGVYSRGLAHGVEVEAVLPLERVRVNTPTDSLCTGADRPRDFCATTSGVGDLSVVLKGRIVDELYLSPVTVAVAAGLRSGELYADDRDRLTTLGDGQTDLGGGVSVGRTDLIGPGWYRVGAWGWYWYRFPNAVEGDRKIPADELSYTLEATLSLHPRFGFGPALQGFQRLDGLDLNQVEVGTPNAWSELKASQVQVGGKVGIYSPAGPTLAIAVLRTVYARNNPSDTLVFSVGLGWYFPGKGVEAPPAGMVTG
jgi:hypothetical protein